MLYGVCRSRACVCVSIDNNNPLFRIALPINICALCMLQMTIAQSTPYHRLYTRFAYPHKGTQTLTQTANNNICSTNQQSPFGSRSLCVYVCAMTICICVHTPHTHTHYVKSEARTKCEKEKAKIKRSRINFFLSSFFFFFLSFIRLPLAQIAMYYIGSRHTHTHTMAHVLFFF